MMAPNPQIANSNLPLFDNIPDAGQVCLADVGEWDVD